MALSDILFKRGVESFHAGQLHDAERHFKSVLVREPGHVASLNILGILLASKQRYSEAESYLRAALKKNANSDSTLYNYGIVLKGLGRPTEALEQFNRALSI